MKDKPIESGSKYGYLTVLDFTGVNNHGKRIYKCRCNCGNEIIVVGSHLKSGNTKSCGCYQKQRASDSSKTHGKRQHPLYRVWSTMKQRCECPTNHKYRIYGARGITVCKEWHDFENFYFWAMQSGYKEGLTIDRIDTNGNYEPTNCRWATAKEQANNKRNTIFIDAYGERHTISEWAEITGLSRQTIYLRIYRHGFYDERALISPRLSEMVQAGKVEVIGKKKDYKTGRTVSVYRRTE